MYNAHVNWLVEEKMCSSLLVMCALLGRSLAWAILQKVCNTFTVKVVSQAEHVSVQAKQTWAVSSSVM